LTKVGTTGFAKAIDTYREFSIFVSLALLKIDHSRLTPLFTEFMLNSPILKELSAQNTRGVGNKNLVLKFINKFPMPAPSLQVQEQIISDLRAFQNKINQATNLQSFTQKELDALMPSILDKAFNGEL
jgi:type I restriction enzyme S subunit